MKETWDALLDLVLPQDCAGCARPGSRWCSACAADLAAWRARPFGPARPTPAPVGLPPCAAGAAYDGVVRAAVLAHKDHGRWPLSAPLGDLLACAVLELHPPAGCVLVPVPSSRAAVRRRGYDHALRLARRAGSRTALRVHALLRQVRPVADQAALTGAARVANLSGALDVRRLARPRAVVVIVDDVMTSGASLAEATRALQAAGYRVHGAATVATTRLRRTHG